MNKRSGRSAVKTGNFAEKISADVSKLIDNIKSVIFMDINKLEYLIAAKIAGGHVMLADSHGVGKTSLARALAGSIRMPESKKKSSGIKIEQFNRIQCTVDLLPQDILGFSRLDGKANSFVFSQGPIFAHFVLCDEINLLTPKTQGSFFQVMEEQTVSIEGNTYELPDPFFIISTMNLKGAHLFPLPAPQLDRFMIQLSMGFPPPEDESAIIKQHGRDDAWKKFKPVIDADDLIEWQETVDKVSIHPEIIDYIVACIRKTRVHPEVLMGASPRAGVKISKLARGLALVRGEDYVTIDLVKEIFIPAVSHRIIMQDPAQSASEILEGILKSVPADNYKMSKRK